MFKIECLELFDSNDNSYKYEFAAGINYFIGSNNTGKTEFYKFIDFMFGSGMDLKHYEWYRGSLKKACMHILCEKKRYKLTRTEYPEVNYFQIVGDAETESIGLSEYKEKLNEIFSNDEVMLRKLRDFVEENMSYRVFTMFNFLGEKGQGVIRDFFDKCREVKYSVKLAPVLNYIFNDNIEKIARIKEQIEEVKKKIQELEVKNASYNFAQRQVNTNLLKLNANVIFNGHNADDVRKEISKIIRMNEDKPQKQKKSVSELEVIYSNLTEQIKVYDNTIKNYRQNEKENENRKVLLSNLQMLIANEPNMAYLVQPLMELVNEVEDSIAFGKYIISDETVAELRKQRDKISVEIKKQDSKFTCYSLEEKSKAVALIQAYLQQELNDVSDELSESKKKLKQLKDELQKLQNLDDVKKIEEYAGLVSHLYESGKDVSEFIKKDVSRDGFKIVYSKRGNILQPVAKATENDPKDINLYLGSMARHTLIQLSGYLAFIDILSKGKKCPIIPILVIDHLSKPFSDNNQKAVGKIIETFYENVSKDEVQIFMFDDVEPKMLGVAPDHCEQLRTENKTGFNPFYRGN